MKIDTVAPDAREVFTDTELFRFSRLLERRAELKAIINAAQEEIGYTDDKKVRHPGIDDEIEGLLGEHDMIKIMYGDQPVQLIPGSRSNLSKERLVELGVSVVTIQQATKVTKFSYLKVG